MISTIFKKGFSEVKQSGKVIFMLGGNRILETILVLRDIKWFF